MPDMAANPSSHEYFSTQLGQENALMANINKKSFLQGVQEKLCFFHNSLLAQEIATRNLKFSRRRQLNW